MAVYPDKKKSGELSGMFRVELQRGKDRYRQRWASHEEATEDEARVKALWAAGEAPQGTSRAIRLPEVHTINSVSVEASGTLWRGSTTEETAWAHVRLMGKLIGADRPLDEIETPDLTKAIRELGRRGKSDGTVNRYLSHFRTFMIWAQDEGFRTVPVAAIKFRWHKEAPGRIRWFTADEEAQLKALLPRNVWLLTKVAIETGCRRDELLTLEPRDVNGNLLHLWVTKTKWPRTVPMTEETTAMLNELLSTGTMPTKRGLRSAWDRVKVKMGLQDDKQFCFHTARHTCATRLVDAGINLLVIKEWLGHKRIETTQRYAHVKPSNLLDALNVRGNLAVLAAAEARKTAGKGPTPQSPNCGVIRPDLDELDEAA